MARKIDDKLFRAWACGDEAAFVMAWRLAFAIALAYATKLFGGPGVCIAGQSPEDVAAAVSFSFVQSVRSGSVQDGNLMAYLLSAVHTRFVDLHRRTRRQVRLGDQAPHQHGSLAERMADAASSPEMTLVGKAEDVARRRAAAVRCREALCAWVEWLACMEPLCATRPTLAAMLGRMKAYLRVELVSAQPGSRTDDGRSLVDLVHGADMRRVSVSFAGLNRFILADRTLTENSVYQRWKYLRRIARDHGVALPPGLGGANRSRVGHV